MDKANKEQILEVLTRGVVDVVDHNHLFKKMLAGDKLRVKFGIDPTGPNIHIGRGSTIKKLREFQKLGHQIVLIIGDGTGRVGDSSDKTEGRRMLTDKEISKNENNYLEQIGKIIDLRKTEVHHNSEWIDELTPRKWIELASLFTIQQMIERDNFSKRIKAGNPIGYQEGMYSMLQGYDSVVIKADVEIGGTDQLFNLLAGRKVQKYFGQKTQDIITLQLLAGTDGRKMSTSWSNVILINDSSMEKFGKIMRLADYLIPVYLECATLVPLKRVQEVKTMLEEGKGNPMDYKKELAYEIVKFYDGERSAQHAQEYFERVVQRQESPKEITTIIVSPSIRVSDFFDILKRTNLVKSKSDAKRLMKQGAIKINDEEFGASDLVSSIGIPTTADGIVVQVGKRNFLRLIGKK